MAAALTHSGKAPDPSPRYEHLRGNDLFCFVVLPPRPPTGFVQNFLTDFLP